MADLEFVSVGIFEKDRVIAGAVIDAKLGTFDVFSAGVANDLRDLVDFFPALSPKRDPVPVRLVIGFFGKAEEIDPRPSFRLEQSPLLAALVHAETDRRQDQRIETLGRLRFFTRRSM